MIPSPIMSTHVPLPRRKNETKIIPCHVSSRGILLIHALLFFKLAIIRILVQADDTTSKLFDPCSFCRAPNIVTKPSAIINTPILSLLNLSAGIKLSCSQLDTIGQAGLLSDEICILLQSKATLRKTCGCALPPTSQLTSSPIATVPVQDKPTLSPTISNYPSKTTYPTSTLTPSTAVPQTKTKKHKKARTIRKSTNKNKQSVQLIRNQSNSKKLTN
jgi:hypothetical protein